MKFIDLVRMGRSFSDEESINLKQIEHLVGEEDFKKIKNLLKQKRIRLVFNKLPVSPQLLKEDVLPRVEALRKDEQLVQEAKKYNLQMEEELNRINFQNLSQSPDTLLKFIAPHITGMDNEKIAILHQLFSTERLHVLLLGDPGTGKTDILRAAAAFSPISSFGLGSGASGVGLTVTVKGDEVIKGLLPLADNGLCAIDELNLMKKTERGSLYNAMEKGFITYDKGNSHFTMDARVKVLATANPTGDKFVGKFRDTLKKQMPFDSALLSRFHLIFLIRAPDVRQFVEISRKIVRNDNVYVKKGDAEFIKQYVEHSESVSVNFPKTFENNVAAFVEGLKSDEKKYLIDVSPRIVIGLIRLAKASARMHLRKEVTKEDVDKAKKIITSSLYIRK